MENSILPIGSAILKNDKKYIIFDYDFKAKSYACAGYPSYFLIDLIPPKKVKEYKSKYNNYNSDDFIKFDAVFELVWMGYRNTAFEEQIKKFVD
ncbi:MAG: hypothetical protein SPK36_00750 [Bacilli bacterium]|nr:hypothetical protein [Bacilli bacterium]